jgi:ATP-dependent Clp protease protease subunit
LRSIGNGAVTVKINSPGGDMFEGIAIYNLLREHPAKVTIDVMGWAASAASIIAMAGDEIRMGLGTFMMVHNAWGVVVGNRHDMRDAATLFDGFDGAIADIYQARSNLDRKAIEKLMDAETFMGPTEAIDKGFADAVSEQLKSADATASSTIDPQLDGAPADRGRARQSRLSEEHAQRSARAAHAEFDRARCRS